MSTDTSVTIDLTSTSSIRAALADGTTSPKLLVELIPAAEYDSETDSIVLRPHRWHADDDNAEVIYDDICGADAAQAYVDEGDWGEDDGRTSWVTVRVWRLGIDPEGDLVRVDEASHKIAINPCEPECTEDDHDWQSPHEIVGGIKENPGVWGSGGGVKIAEVCMHCGCRRATDTWAQDPADGEQGLTSVSYDEGYYCDQLAALDDDDDA